MQGPVKTASIMNNLQPRELDALTELVASLRKRFPGIIQHVLLFGSKARGESDPESDIDLLIVVEDYNWALEKEITRIATETDYAFGVVVSDHVISKVRFHQMGARREPLYHSIQRDGIDLWTLEPQPTT